MIIAHVLEYNLLSFFVRLLSQKTAVLIRNRHARSMNSTSVSETWGGRYGKHSSPRWPKLLCPTGAYLRHSCWLILVNDTPQSAHSHVHCHQDVFTEIAPHCVLLPQKVHLWVTFCLICSWYKADKDLAQGFGFQARLVLGVTTYKRVQ